MSRNIYDNLFLNFHIYTYAENLGVQNTPNLCE